MEWVEGFFGIGFMVPCGFGEKTTLKGLVAFSSCLAYQAGQHSDTAYLALADEIPSLICPRTLRVS